MAVGQVHSFVAFVISTFLVGIPFIMCDENRTKFAPYSNPNTTVTSPNEGNWVTNKLCGLAMIFAVCVPVIVYCLFCGNIFRSKKNERHTCLALPTHTVVDIPFLQLTADPPPPYLQCHSIFPPKYSDVVIVPLDSSIPVQPTPNVTEALPTMLR